MVHVSRKLNDNIAKVAPMADFSFVPQTLEKISVLILRLVKSCACRLSPLTHMVVCKPGTVTWLT